MHPKRLTAGIYTCLLLLLAVCYMPWAQANTLLSASPSQASYSLAPYTEFWHADEQPPVTLTDLLSQPRRFEPAHQAEDLNFGYTPHHVWLRTQVHNDSPKTQRWLIQFEYPFLDYVTLYTLRLQGSNVQRSGSAVPVEQRARSTADGFSIGTSAP